MNTPYTGIGSADLNRAADVMHDNAIGLHLYALTAALLGNRALYFALLQEADLLEQRVYDIDRELIRRRNARELTRLVTGART